jgi:cell division protein FtsI (penicillin-binding protein 3)
MINSRALLVTFILIAGFAALTVRLFNIQVLDHNYYSEIARNQQDKALVIKAERGLIKDRNGEILSYTQDDVSFFVDTRMLNSDSKKKIAAKFSEVFSKSEEHYLKLMESKKGNVFLEEKAPREKLLSFKDFVVDGLVTIEDPTRVYGNGSLAAHILGYVNNDLIGLDGVERVFDNYLNGIDGLLYVERDVQGRIITVKEEMSRQPKPGSDVYLTIDTKYQKILEQELKKGVDDCGAASGIGILMNPNTGEIIALANYPTFNPSKYFAADDKIRRNRALTDTYEPGSTMKALTMSILLDKELVNEDELVNTENGRYKIANANIIDVHKYEKLTVREVLEQSSNVGITKLVDRIDDRTFYKYLRDFGFGNSTSISLPGESSGFLKKPDFYSTLSKPFMAFGYEISVTPIQMVTAFSALVNGGILYQPRIVDKIVDEQGRTIEKFEPVKIRNVISSETSERIKNLLFGVVEHGTGKLARCDNMLVGGKTGTAQKFVDGEYVKDYNASFIGFFPADNPKVVGLILIGSPATGKYGGVVAAPVYQKIVNRLVEEDINVIPQRITIAREQETIDEILALTKEEDPVFLQTANVADYTPKAEQVNQYASRITMPNLVNRSLRDALAVLNEMGLRYDIEGSGKVVEQSIKPGTEISYRSICRLKCEATNTLRTLGLY